MANDIQQRAIESGIGAPNSVRVNSPVHGELCMDVQSEFAPLAFGMLGTPHEPLIRRCRVHDGAAPI